MCERYRIAMTQSFGRSLSALANKNQELIWRRLPELQANPHPDGSQPKLRLEQFDDVYRWRVGKYRVFYRMGPDCLVSFLVVTYTRTLAEFVRTLTHSALSPSVRLATNVYTLDSLMHELCPDIPSDTIVRTRQAQKLEREQARENAFERLLSPDAQRDRRLAASIKGITDVSLLREITEVIIGRGLTSLDAYLEADRSGRRRPLNRTQREAIWALYEALTDILRAEGSFLHEELRQLALDQVQNAPEIQRYHAVVVDEVQDLTPVAVRLLHALCQDPRYLVLASDEHQTIHLRTFNWRSIEQAISPCDGTAKRLALQMNHRCPPEIAAAVRAYRHALPNGDGRTAPPSDRKRAGRARPTVLALARWERWRQVLPDELLRLRQAHRLPWDHCAVLAPRNDDMPEVELALRSQHISAEIVEHSKPQSPAATVKVLTWHNAKGLEFPAVFVLFPDWEPPLASFTEPPAEEVEESIDAWRRTAAVALGCASRHLIVLRPVSGRSALLAGLDGDPWEMRVVEAGDESASDTAWDDLPF